MSLRKPVPRKKVYEPSNSMSVTVSTLERRKKRTNHSPYHSSNGAAALPVGVDGVYNLFIYFASTHRHRAALRQNVDSVTFVSSVVVQIIRYE